MSESLIIIDGTGALKSLQVDSGSDGYIANHAVVSTAQNSEVAFYYTNGPNGWEWEIDKGIVTGSEMNSTRKGLIIHNNSDYGKCYILVGSNFDTISDVSEPPSKFSFLLDAGGTYFADTTSAVLKHMFYVPSSSYIPDSSSMKVIVTQIY